MFSFLTIFSYFCLSIKIRKSLKPFTKLILPLFILCYIIACNDDKYIDSQLDKAEVLMEQQPDTALAILKRIEAPEKLSDKQYALWCLLYTQAQDKNYVKHESDSLIRIAVKHFENTNDKPRLMKAWYYNAVICYDLGDSPRAQDYYLKALEAGKDSKDHALLGRIYSNLGLIYIYQNLYPTALIFQKKAAEHFLYLKDSTNTGRTLQNIARIYVKNAQLDSAIIYYEQTLPFLTQRNRVAICNEIGSLYKRIGVFDKALEYIQLAYNSSFFQDDMTPIYLNLGDLYRRIRLQDSAYYYLNLCIQSPNIHSKTGAYQSLSYLEEQKHNWLQYAVYHQQYRALQDSLDRIKQTENIQRIQSVFDYRLIEEERAFHEKEAYRKTVWFYRLGIFTIASFAVLLMLFFYLWRKRQFERERNEKELRIREQKYRHSQEYILTKEQEIQKLKEALTEETDKLSRELLAAQRKILDSEIKQDKEKRSLQKKWNEEFRKSPIRQLFISGNERITSNDWIQLEIWIDRIYPNMVSYLRNVIPTIDDEKLKVCCLVMIGVPVKRIALLLNKTSSAISKRKERLYERLTGKKGSAKDLDSFLSDMFEWQKTNHF
ncbi:tetratricopeptide (TPR) repeat protein [Parabacteroides sp. PF5-5]|uniref:tetratricopeptide repeat protein n=1 Tax=unclassified Parabacteroides TaxID=2649774 RepID=UPI0024733AB7|nr:MULTISPECIES: tetratricopeptide repeat protein [unclassified Parabacteroides]MDH6304562.1 tetratricopeptide (TPR) repeat protein [Parabacteroides sp. PH5-39]MDH6315825.1 tetratricopeptide (TPR) repeat protein [Parabacteroides sp. PF5-13]MDH6319484.1 tetratricopeptide (TPR) repeat protein [Parabacteroides sp. PH5-13]MDH6323215.1 tetratricopeptide (TPR) repeat protein [Parabacteroides sp. PH5-8]MDH6327017.1 tetratricopeptide (TPR) repeat protein [Parabacteroides sp. PH5-41]